MLALGADDVRGAVEATARPGRLPGGVSPVHYDISIEPDAAALRFTGRAAIDIEVERPTDAITLNAVDLDIRTATLDGARPAQLTLDEPTQTATLRFPRPVPAGRHRLVLAYSGRIYTNATGLYAVDYTGPDGPRRVLTTQFEVADGRRFAPMWDEPAAKASFALDVLVPKEQTAYSNMPAASSRIEGRHKRIRFQTTPRMSSYLLHLSIGEFDRVARQVAGVDVGVVTRKGAGASASFALDAAAEILPWLDAYFGMPYPLPKLDMIAIPGSSQFFAAMENWGAIMYFDDALLIDPTRATESDRQRVYTNIAHEIAHQWFGDLVTMQWWDDLWLNEGFASWMESKLPDALHPEWQPWLQLASGLRENALRLDARPSTHPVIQPIPTVDAASLAFDAITYNKGNAVVRMLEDALGEAGFREGIRRYLKKYAYANTTTDQLWAELAAATDQPVADIAHDFTLQPGVPLLRVETGACEAGHTPITLTQGRFEPLVSAPRPMLWRIPVRLRALDGGAEANLILDKTPVSHARLATCNPIVVNAGQAGYFRTLYSAADLARLRQAYVQIAPADQLGLLSDAWALGEAGLMPATSYPELAQAIPTDGNPLIWNQVALTFDRIDSLFDGSELQPAWRRFARSRLQPVFARVGWNPAPREPAIIALLRETLISALGGFDDAEIVAGAKQRFLQSEKDPGALPAAIRQPVLGVAALHADSALWEEILHRARTTNDPIEQQRLFEALGAVRDPLLAQRALELALSDVPPVTFAPGIMSAVGYEHPALAVDFALAHEQQVLARLEVSSRWAFIPELAETSSDAALAEKVRAYMQASTPADARQPAEAVIAGVLYRARVRTERLPELEAWARGSVD